MKLYVVCSTWVGTGVHVVLARNEEQALALTKRALCDRNGWGHPEDVAYLDSLYTALVTDDPSEPFVSEEYGEY